MTGIFSKAIETTTASNRDCSTPEMFQRYITDNQLKAKGTAQHISIQSFSQLDKELKENLLMVFRLGSRVGENGTYFSLAKTVNGWEDYFLFDEVLFCDTETVGKALDWKSEKYLSFSVIPKLTETSHVNLALTSGVLEHALQLDSNTISIPATGRGNYTFTVKPNSELSAAWVHNSGQVEIDSVFVGKRKGKKYLIVIEAKSGKYPDSLAKHKLVYPILAIAPEVPEDYEIMPVYMRVKEDSESFTFYIAECTAPEEAHNMYINELTSKRTSIIKIAK